MAWTTSCDGTPQTDYVHVIGGVAKDNNQCILNTNAIYGAGVLVEGDHVSIVGLSSFDDQAKPTQLVGIAEGALVNSSSQNVYLDLGNFDRNVQGKLFLQPAASGHTVSLPDGGWLNTNGVFYFTSQQGHYCQWAGSGTPDKNYVQISALPPGLINDGTCQP